MRRFIVAMLLLATVPFALAASCGNKNPDCLDEKAMMIRLSKPVCKPSPETPPRFIYPSSTISPSARLK